MKLVPIPIESAQVLERLQGAILLKMEADKQMGLKLEFESRTEERFVLSVNGVAAPGLSGNILTIGVKLQLNLYERQE